jgi:metallophosphoesterase (TIGR00282 family)
MRDAGVDVITTGNHIWAQQDVDEALNDDDLRLLRPLNYSSDLTGQGFCTVRVKGVDVTVVSLLGRVFMTPLDDPFAVVDRLISDVASDAARRPVMIVDFHAEATSEKVAMGWHLAGRVSAVFGTHTHVPTADIRVLPGDTGYVTDLGMVGPMDSVIGTAIEPSLARFTTGRPRRLPVPDGPTVFNSVLFELDPGSGTCYAVRRIDREDMVHF